MHMETRPRMENEHGKEAWNVEWTWKRGLEWRMGMEKRPGM